jgi:hydroxypyruvate reductase
LRQEVFFDHDRWRLMIRSQEQLRADGLRIWRAGLEGVRSPRLVLNALAVEGRTLHTPGEVINLDDIDRITVVGAGKAAAGMAQAVEQVLGPSLLAEKRLTGCVSVPADCLAATDAVQLCAGRPAGVNEPTAEGVACTANILRLVSHLGPRDLCLCLISGGGSALLPAPIEGLSLADKVFFTRELSARGATIEQLNVLRRELSAVKGGGLAHACRAGRLIALVISDVLGDDLRTIASGPTAPTSLAPEAAIEILQRFSLADAPAGARVVALLRQRGGVGPVTAPLSLDAFVTPAGCRVSNHIIGNNAAAVDAAGVEAERLGYSHAMIAAVATEGRAEELARHLAQMVGAMRSHDGPDCLISGGEPTVELAPVAVRGRGGRNQQLCLAVLSERTDWRGAAFISGGTDGEDGPTDAAGACVDEAVAAKARQQGLDVQGYLARNDAYAFFDAAGGLLFTGPTHTNVCDLRVVTLSR